MKIGNLPWIKLHRKFLQWEWFKDAQTVQVFIYLLLSAATEATKWQGLMIRRGQVLVSQRHLATVLGMSRQNVRTCFHHLQCTGEIEIDEKTVTHYGTLINICKYDSYQQSQTYNQPTDNPQITQLFPHQSTQQDPVLNTYCSKDCNEKENTVNPTDNQQDLENLTQYIRDNIITRSRYINISPTRNNIVVEVEDAREEKIEKLRVEIYSSQIKTEKAMMLCGVDDRAEFLKMCEDALAEWSLTGSNDISWQHLMNHLRKKVQCSRENKGRPGRPKEGIPTTREERIAHDLQLMRDLQNSIKS